MPVEFITAVLRSTALSIDQELGGAGARIAGRAGEGPAPGEAGRGREAGRDKSQAREGSEAGGKEAGGEAKVGEFEIRFVPEECFADAVRQMQALGPENPLSWMWQWYTHFVDGATNKSAEITRIFGPTATPQSAHGGPSASVNDAAVGLIGIDLAPGSLPRDTSAGSGSAQRRRPSRRGAELASAQQ